MAKSAPQTPHKHSSSSSLKRRMAVFVPVKTTAMSMNIQAITHTPSHSSPTLLINFKEHRFSPSLMSTGDITMFVSRMNTNGKLPFITHKGLFEPTVMFFGLTNSPTTFQQFMNDSFHDMIIEEWLVMYMDDLLIYCSNTTTHTERTKWALQHMIELDLHLKLEKCTFAAFEVEYLGMIVKPGQLVIDLVKLNGITHWPTPSKVKGVYSFLGFTNFYC